MSHRMMLSMYGGVEGASKAQCFPGLLRHCCKKKYACARVMRRRRFAAVLSSATRHCRLLKTSVKKRSPRLCLKRTKSTEIIISDGRKSVNAFVTLCNWTKWVKHTL